MTGPDAAASAVVDKFDLVGEPGADICPSLAQKYKKPPPGGQRSSGDTPGATPCQRIARPGFFDMQPSTLRRCAKFGVMFLSRSQTAFVFFPRESSCCDKATFPCQASSASWFGLYAGFWML